MKKEKILYFRMYSLQIDPSFWTTLYEQKLNVWKLDDSTKEIYATISHDGNSVSLDRNSFQSNFSQSPDEGHEHDNEPDQRHKNVGHIVVFNTYNELCKTFAEGKQAILKRTLDEGKEFVLLVYADLKKYSFDYFFAIPVHYLNCPMVVRLETNRADGGALDVKIHANLWKEPDQIALPWTIRNLVSQSYIQGVRRFTIVSRGEKTDCISIRCLNDTSKVRYGGWVSVQVCTVNMSEMMDPTLVAEQNAELNLKLMMWKHEPTLPIDKLRGVSCLLIGSGTLGCGIARNLIAWGIRKIAFLDCSQVSHSNPVRQSLYTTNDFGKNKAPTAAKALKNILPSVNSTGHVVDIPMPGHSNSSSYEDYKKLDDLVQKCDVIFLSTDSKEGRWLPILMAKRYGKDVMNVALGYDTMTIQWITEDSGCYFCSDPKAPQDSMSSRTIDEKCTITRPGISSIASGVAVELFVDAIRGNLEYDQIRFNLSDMKFSRQKSSRYEHCSCCSLEMITELTSRNYGFVENVRCIPSLLDDITGYNEECVSDILTVSETDEVLTWGDEGGTCESQHSWPRAASPLGLLPPQTPLASFTSDTV
jgi:molybdopterin/thiamine biosynthesis adenylyltransferase